VAEPPVRDGQEQECENIYQAQGRVGDWRFGRRYDAITTSDVLLIILNRVDCDFPIIPSLFLM
jgi:hypothetical protein